MSTTRFRSAALAAILVLCSIPAAAQDLGVSTLAGLPNTSGSSDGAGSVARFRSPQGVAVDASGNIWVCDTANHTIRQVTAGGNVTTFAGFAGASGTREGTGASARFNGPRGIAVHSATGTLYVADSDNHAIRKITSAGVMTNLAGFPGLAGDDDGTGSNARFRNPQGIALDSLGDLYVADTGNHIIRKVTAATGVVTTYAGIPGSQGSDDGSLATARFRSPLKLAFDGAGNLYITDTDNNTIRKITTGGTVSTLAGLAGAPTVVTDGTGSAARFARPAGITFASDGNLYVSDRSGPVIRRVTLAGDVLTVAGLAGSTGTANGTGANARFSGPFSIAAHPTSMFLYVTDTNSDTIRLATPSIPDTATIDSPTGLIGQTRQLDTSPQTATSWQWTVLMRPPGSTATFAPSSTIRNPTITPDGTGLWRFQLEATSPSGRSVSLIDLFVKAVRYDFDRDGKADIAIWRRNSATWFIQLSRGGQEITPNIGQGSNDKALSFDVNGDARSDKIIYRLGTFFHEGTNVGGTAAPADTRTSAGDFNGDRQWDYPRYEPFGTWRIILSSGGTQVRNFGTQGDLPVASDYDGDGFTDLAVFRPSEGGWYIQRSDGGGTMVHLGFGTVPGDLPIPADYDGDGKDDIAIFRPGEGGWHVMLSTGGFSSFTGWGFLPGDVPVPADYDGDRKADIAIFRPGEGGWHILYSGGGSTTVTGWGTTADDQPVNRPPYL